MIVTKKWIMSHRTPKGAWTRPQIEALGIDWPPRHGWMDRAIGKTINNSERIQFEAKLGIKQVRKLRKGTTYSLAEQSFDNKKKEALRRYEERTATEQLDRELLVSGLDHTDLDFEYMMSAPEPERSEWMARIKARLEGCTCYGEDDDLRTTF